jgi:MFS family permease
VSDDPGRGRRATFGEVFGLAEFRALWMAQMLSVTGDQLARVALTVLVYDRTRSALLAAVTFAASVVPQFVGGVTLAGLADRLPRRQVMIGADLASAVLVVAMALPGMPLVVLIALLVAVTMVGALFQAARSATYPDILHGDQYVLGVAVTTSTMLTAQVAGFAAGGAAVAFLGVRPSLLADAATFGASALITRVGVRARPVPRPEPAPEPGPGQPAGTSSRRAGRHARPGHAAQLTAGLRLVFGSPAMRTPLLFGLLATFYELPQGVVVPLARAAGGGAVAVGLILAAQALGSALGSIGFSRFVEPARRLRWTGPLAVAACASLALFASHPGLGGTLVVLALSGLFGCYQLAANAAFVQATPPSQRSQAFGIAQGGLSLCQGSALILAGAAAEHVSPDAVIAAAGVIGALCALAVACSGPARQYWRAAVPERTARAARAARAAPRHLAPARHSRES